MRVSERSSRRRHSAFRRRRDVIEAETERRQEEAELFDGFVDEPHKAVPAREAPWLCAECIRPVTDAEMHQ